LGSACLRRCCCPSRKIGAEGFSTDAIEKVDPLLFPYTVTVVVERRV